MLSLGRHAASLSLHPADSAITNRIQEKHVQKGQKPVYTREKPVYMREKPVYTGGSSGRNGSLDDL